AAAISGMTEPPSTTMPSGAPRAGSQGGKRCSSGSIRRLPSGDRPATAIRTTLVTMSQLASRRIGVSRRTMPTKPISTKRFDGTTRTPRSFESTKNMSAPVVRSAARLPPLRVTRLGLLVRRIEAGQLPPLLHLGEDPALVQFVLGAFVRDEFDQRLRNDDGAVLVNHDHVIGEDRAAAAGDRLLPADEGQPVDRSGRGNTRAPD